MKRQIVFSLLLWSCVTCCAQAGLNSNGKIRLSNSTHLIVNGDIKASNEISNSGAISLTGSWESSPGFLCLGTGPVNFRGNSPQWIDANGASLPCLTVENPAGVFLDSTNLTIRDSLVFNIGNLFVGDQILDMDAAATIENANADHFVVTNGTGGLRRHILGNLIYPIGPDPSTYAPCEIDNANQPVQVLAHCYKHVYHPAASGNVVLDSAVDQTWVIDPGTAPASFNATITCYWDSAAALPGFSESQCGVARPVGNTWEIQTMGAANLNPTGYYSRQFHGLQEQDSLAVWSKGSLTVEVASGYQAPEVSCSPVPSHGPLTLAISSPEMGAFQVCIRSIDGKKMRQFLVEKDAYTVTNALTCEGYANGAYLLEVESPSGLKTFEKFLLFSN